MKKLITILTVSNLIACSLIFLPSFRNEINLKAKASSIEGCWRLVQDIKLGKKVPKLQLQFKSFNDGIYTIYMTNPDGTFHGAGAGTYKIDGNKFVETFNYYSDSTWVNYADEQEWKIVGDTLIVRGFKKVFDEAASKCPQICGVAISLYRNL